MKQISESLPPNFSKWSQDAQQAYLAVYKQNCELEETVSALRLELKQYTQSPSSVEQNAIDARHQLTDTAEKVGKKLNATSVFINDWHPQKRNSTVQAAYISARANQEEHIDDIGENYSFMQSYIGQRLASLPYWINHYDDDFGGDDRLQFNHYDIKTVLYIPVVIDDVPIGYLEAWDTQQKREFSQTEIEIALKQTHEITHTLHKVQSQRIFNDEKIRHELVMNNMRGSVVQLDSAGRVEYANATFCNLLQCDFAEIVGKFLKDIWEIPINEETNELLFQKPTGEAVWLHVSVSYIYSDLGRINGTVYVLTDITQRKQTEEETFRLKEHYRLLLEAVSDYSYLMRVNEDQSIQLEWMGGKPEDVIGYTAEEFMEGSVYDFALDTTEPGYRTLSEQSFRGVLENKRTFIEILVQHKNGSHVWLSVIRQPIWDAQQQRVVGYYGALTDITPFKLAQQAIQDQEELKSELQQEQELRQLRNHYLSTIAHDFKTPLSAISLANQTLQKYGDTLFREQRDTYMERIDISLRYLNKMIDEVTLVVRAESGNLDFRPERLHPRTLFSDLLHDYNSISTHNHQIQFNPMGTFSEGYLDKDMLNHILFNLLSNAVKYSPSDSPIMLNLWQDDHTLTFEIIDKGIGIPEDEQHFLFEPFHRAKNAHYVPGTGLGLSIVKQMVKLHGGTIDFETKINEGTKFIVRIPVRSA